MPPIINGLLFGLIFVLSIGPAFFTLIQTSIQKGFRPAMFMAFGISLTDIFFVSITLLGVASILKEPRAEQFVGVVGTIFLILYGSYTWLKKPKIKPVHTDDEGDARLLKYTLKGLLLNGLNPLNIIFWFTVIATVSVSNGYSQEERTLFFMGVLTTVLVTDISKAFVAHRLRYLITPKLVMSLNRIVGMILILFGLRIVYFLYHNHWIAS